MRDTYLFCRPVRLSLMMTLVFLLTVFISQAAALTDSYSANGTWVAPAGVISATVEAWGGGGAGGGATGNRAGGGGGGGGQYARAVVSVVPGNSYSVVVGAGGIGTTGDGSAGEDSIFNGSTLVAKGGAGGGRAASNNSGGGAGIGGVAGGIGDQIYAGGDGAAGDSTWGGAGGGGAGSTGAGGNASGTSAGSGTLVSGGDGGAGRTSSGTGLSGSTAGGGGGGGYAGNNTNRNGGDGASGQVSISYTPLPLVSTILLASYDPTASNTLVSWTVSFSQSVTGVDATDFALAAAGGTTAAGITAVSGSGMTWTVTANTGTSSTGTLGLNLIDDDSIMNTGVPLGGIGAGNGNYAGPVYTLAPPAPVLNKTASAAAAVLGDVVTFTLTVTNPYSVALSNIVVSDPLPAGMSYGSHVATLGTVAVAGQAVTWTIPSLPATGSAQMILAVSLSQQGLLTNTVTSPGSGPASISILVLASAVTHFRMDEPVASWTGAAGEVIDSGGTALHGRRLISASPTTTNVIDPTPTITSQHLSVVGGFCNAASFDGRAIVEVADSPLFDYTTRLSASAWIYPTSYPPSGGLYSILSNDVNYEFHINSAGKLFWWWNSSTLTSATTIPLNRWTHVTITFDSSAGVRRQRIYINGVLDTNTNNWQGSLAANNCNFYVGGDVATGAACSIIAARNFRGLIDEVKLYSFELSPAEVVADMTLGRACSGTFDHVRIEHDGVGSVCAPERVTVKACLDSSCTTLYPGSVTVNLAPTGWVGGDTFTFSGGIGTRQLSRGSSGSVTLGTNSVSPTPASASRCFSGTTETCTMSFAAASCAFDAVEPGMAPQTPIYTKLVGVPFNVDVLALLSATTVNTAFTGTVAVDLVDATASACPTGSGLNPATSITFSGSDAGRKPVTFSYANAARDVRVRARVGTSAPACSADNFAIRPQAFTLTSTDATNISTSGLPAIKAGAPFNLRATALAGYDGTPVVDNTRLTGSPNAGVLSGSFTAANSATGVAGSSFAYSEVGHFGMGLNAVYDSAFTAVDQPGDCLVGYANTLSGGKYGCSFGSIAVPFASGSSGFGRFVPARFSLTSNLPLFASACNSSFTYLGQPFAYLLNPQLTLTAQNAGGATTLNYGGVYWKMSSLLGSRSYVNNAATAATLMVATPGSVAWSGTADTDGAGTAILDGESLVYNKPGTAEVPFATNATLTFPAADLTDSDGVCYDPDSNGICDPLAIAAIGATEQRYGRLVLQNAYGPETADAVVPLNAEYFTANGYQLNVQDSCTVYNVTDLLLSNYQGNLASGDTTASGAGVLSSGFGSLFLSAPGVTKDGSVDLLYDLDLAGLGWLKENGLNPRGKATFGIYKGNERLIYMRESVQ